MPAVSRRSALGGVLGSIGATVLAAPAIAQDTPLKIGLMLPFSGIHAALGEAIATGFDLHIRERGRTMGGRSVAVIRVNDESDPAKAPSNVNRILGREQADVLVGTVDADVTMDLVRAAHGQQIPLVIPHAGNVAATREACAPSIFRSSFSNWQPGYGMGKALAAKGVKKAVWVSWDHVAGNESGDGFRDGLSDGGAELIKVVTVPFPETNFQSILARLPNLGADAVGCLFMGEAAIKFIQDYTAAGLRDKLPLCGSGFLTERVVKTQAAPADGIQTALHYGEGLDNPKNLAFRAKYKAVAGREADIYAVQGYDAAQIMGIGMDAARGDTLGIDEFAAAIRAAKIDSPRGTFTLSASHNPVQTMWLREVRNGENHVIGTAAEALADPGTSCGMP
jgi:branched-chain amino acid transport system substrate-binding protein